MAEYVRGEAIARVAIGYKGGHVGLKAQGAVPPSDEVRARSGARWFYWIAGLTMVNSIVAFLGTDLMMVFGLASTLVGTYIGIEIGGAGAFIGMGIAVCLALAFVGFGWMAERGATWAFITGMVIYLADAAVSVYLNDWFGLAAHAFALVLIGMGLQASLRLRRQSSSSGAVPGMETPVGFGSQALPVVPAAPVDQEAGFATATAPDPLN